MTLDPGLSHIQPVAVETIKYLAEGEGRRRERGKRSSAEKQRGRDNSQNANHHQRNNQIEGGIPA